MPASARFTVIVSDEAVIDPSVIMAASPSELQSARRMLSWQRHGDQMVVKRRTHRVGATRIGAHVFSAPPPMPLRTFLGLVLISYDLRPDQVPVAGIARDTPPELFRAALGASLVFSAELVTRQHIHQAYEARVERLQLIRGRPQWTNEIGRIRDGSVACEYQLKTTDTLLNRIVLAGLLEARKLQPHGPLRRRAERQAFVWRGLAEPPPVVRRDDVDTARALLTRQTAHYKGALGLTEALLFGTRSPGEEPAEDVDLPIYDLAVLFESLVAKLVRAAADKVGLTTRLQHTREDALLDAEQKLYRRIRPDVVVYQHDRPIAVLDAKYKPRYTRGGPEPPLENRVSVADAYQLFFYAERLRRIYSTPQPIPAYVVAPLLDDPVRLARLSRRTIIWQQAAGDEPVGLRIIPVPLVEVLDVVLSGGSFGAACLAAPELIEAVSAPALATA